MKVMVDILGVNKVTDSEKLSGETGQAFEQKVISFGKEIFSHMNREKPGFLHANFWSDRVMEWSMAKPELKANMFRLVDVLPALKTSSAIARHVKEYLSQVAQTIHSIAAWGVNIPPQSIRARFASIAVRQGVRQMASQFIAGESAQKALSKLKTIRENKLAFTVDLLGEYCVSEQEASEYMNRYLEALNSLGSEVSGWKCSAPIMEGHPGEISPVCVSIKLSALYSQCNPLNFDRSVKVLTERLSNVVRTAQEQNAMIYVDAEDTANNPIIYKVFQDVFSLDEFKDFPYPGIVLQAYAKESEKTLLELLSFAQKRGKPIAVRLVKGAYWDSETVSALQNHWEPPLFQKKESSDANFEKLTKILLQNIEHVLPAFGSHNIRSLAHACCYAEELGIKQDQFELQMLYGMADPIANAFKERGYLVRFYVPLGELIPGMGYLVRRLLENTSNESFLRHTFFDESEIETLLKKPAAGS